MSLERLPIGKNGMYLEKKPAKDGALYTAKEYSSQVDAKVRTTVQVIDQNTVNYHTPLGSITLRKEQINGVLPRLQFFPKLGRRPFELTWKPSE